MESEEGAGGLEENVKDPEKGGGEAAGVQIFLQIHRPVGVALWCRDVGGYPPHGTCTGGFSRPGGAVTDRADATAEVGWDMGVHLDRGGERGGGVRADGNLHSEKAEYDYAVYCNATDSGPVRGRIEEADGTGRYAVVGIGGD